jgi:hypothetical protein
MPATTTAGARPVNPVLASSIRWPELRAFTQVALDLVPFIQKETIAVHAKGPTENKIAAGQHLDRFLAAARELGDTLAEAGGTPSAALMPEPASSGACTPSTDVRKLQTTITTMEALADEAFSQISAIATLALRALEAPSGCGDLESIAQALHVIRGKAHDINDCIGNEADEVGCRNEGGAAERRYEARQATQATRGGVQ